MGGRFGRRDERLKRKQIAEQRLRLYERTDLDELAGLHRLNFEIRRGEIASAEVKRGLFRSSLIFRLAGSGRPIRFGLRRAQMEEARRLTDRMPH